MRTFEETRDLPCSAAEIYGVVMDIEAYETFLPWVAHSRVLERGDGELTAELVADFAGMHQSFRTVDRFVENKMVEIRLLDGPFNFLESLWTFENLGDERCRVHFSIEFEFRSMMLDLVASPIFSTACKTMVHTFESRAVVLGQK